jgi:hypothetical protein
VHLWLPAFGGGANRFLPVRRRLQLRPVVQLHELPARERAEGGGPLVHAHTGTLAVVGSLHDAGARAGVVPGRGPVIAGREGVLSQSSVFAEGHSPRRIISRLGDQPLVVVTAAQDAQAGWLPLQDRLASLSTNSSHRVVACTHIALVTDRMAAQLSIQALRDVLSAVRSHAALPNS